MSLDALKWAFEQKVGSAARKSVLVAIADHADTTGECWPGHDLLTQKTELHRATVIRHIQALADAGLLVVEGRASMDGRQLSNRYRLRFQTGVAQRDPGVAQSDGRGSQGATDGGRTARPEPSEEPSEEQKNVLSPKKQSVDPRVPEVFDYWKQRLGKTGTVRLTPGRQEKIRARLEDGTTVKEMRRAIDGCASSEFHTQNSHTDLTLILRNREKVEQFMEFAGPGSDNNDFFGGAV